jgi:hypothetical protein
MRALIQRLEEAGVAMTPEAVLATKLASKYKVARNSAGLPPPNRDRDPETKGRYKVVGTPEWALFQAPAIMTGAASPALVQQILAALQQAQKDGLF